MDEKWWHGFIIEGNILVFTMRDGSGEKEEEIIVSSEKLDQIKNSLTISEGPLPKTFRVHDSYSKLVDILKSLDIPVPSFFVRDAK